MPDKKLLTETPERRFFFPPCRPFKMLVKSKKACYNIVIGYNFTLRGRAA